MHRSAFARIFKTRPALRSRRVDELTRRRRRRPDRRADRGGVQARDDPQDTHRARADARLPRGRPESGARRAGEAAARAPDAYPAAARRPRRAGRRAARTPVRAAAARDRRVWSARVRARDRRRRRPGRASGARSVSGRRPRRTSATATCTCPTTCTPRSWPGCRRARIATSTAPLFPGLDEAALRTAIGRACKLAGVPHFSPHGLRRRRGSLHYKRTGSLAEVAELLGDSKRVAADHYVYALVDYTRGRPATRVAAPFRLKPCQSRSRAAPPAAPLAAEGRAQTSMNAAVTAFVRSQPRPSLNQAVSGIRVRAP